MPLSPRDGFAATKPADISSPQTTQRYFKVPTQDLNGNCVGTIASYSLFNEMIAQQENLLNFMSIPVVGNDEFSLQKVAEKLLTGSQDYEVNSILVDGKEPFLKGSEIDSEVNLDDYLTSGYYHNNTNSFATLEGNFPEEFAGVLHVFTNGNLTMQTYQTFATNNFYIRRRDTSNVWGDWSKMMTNTNDGSGSGFDSDLLDGNHGSHYTNANNLNAGKIPNDRMTGQDYSVNKIAVESGVIQLALNDYLRYVDADNYLRGHQNGVAGQMNVQFNIGDFSSVRAADYMSVNAVSVRNAAILSSGTIDDARLPATISSDITGNAATATQASNADKLDGYHANSFARPTDLIWTPTVHNADNTLIPYSNGYYRAYRIGDIIFGRFQADMDNVVKSGNPPYITLPVSAELVQLCPNCWSTYSVDPTNQIESINAVAFGNGVVRENILYFKNNNYDGVDSDNLDTDHLVITFQYLAV